MCPAKVECPDGVTVVVPEGQILDSRIEGFDHIPQDDKLELKWESVMGVAEGYQIAIWGGRQGTDITVTTKSVTYNPPISESIRYGIKLDGKTWVMPGGTKISPIEE